MREKISEQFQQINFNDYYENCMREKTKYSEFMRTTVMFPCCSVNGCHFGRDAYLMRLAESGSDLDGTRWSRSSSRFAARASTI